MKNNNKIILATEASLAKVPDVKWVVNGFLPLGFKSIISGTTGSNKSYLSMELGIRVANANPDGTSKFLDYYIPKPLKILYIDNEVGENEMIRRFKRIEKTVGIVGNNYGMVSLPNTFVNSWPEIIKITSEFKPDLVIIDNLYSSNDKNMSKAVELKPVLQSIDKLKNETGATPLLIHHFNKGTNEMGMTIDRMQGASTLQNWAEYVIVMSKTNVQDLRLIKVVKSRGTHQSEEVYGLRWNSSSFTLEMEGIIRDYPKYLTSKVNIMKWEKALKQMDKEFDSQEFCSVVIDDMKMSKETAYNWLRELQTIGMIEKTKHGQYKKTKMKISVKEIEKKLKLAIEKEEYEKAAILRDKIKNMTA